MEEKQTLEQAISVNVYNEIAESLQRTVGNEASEFLLPAVKKALTEGSPDCKEQILREWLCIDSVRVCSRCGEIMQEGWYLDAHGYACSDECCMWLMGIDKEEFDKYSIYKDDIEEYLHDIKSTRTIEDLTPQEIKEITESIVDNLDAYYYTEWY